MTLFRSSRKPSSGEQASLCDLNLLKPDIYGVLEEGERKASLIRLVFVGVALVVWVVVALRAWEIRVIAIERKSDEIEITRISKQIEQTNVKLGVVPKQVREARNELTMQVDWAGRLSSIRNLVPDGCVFGQYSVCKDAAIQISGYVRDPGAYAQVLDAVSKADFVAGIRSASLTERQSHYEFRIVVTTHVSDGNE